MSRRLKLARAEPADNPGVGGAKPRGIVDGGRAMISKRHALGRVSVALLVIVSGAVLAVSRPAAKRARTDSREALLASFDSDVAELVYEWDREDSRPEPVRRA